MAFQVVMPRLGWTMETGSLVEWRRAEGERVEAGDILLAVESDKAIQEVEAVESGILHIPPTSPAPGVQVPVGTLLAYLLQPGEALPSGAPTQGGEPMRAAGAPALSPLTTAPGGSSAGAQASGPAPTISPRARRVARELGVAWQVLQGSGRTGRIVERDVRRAAASRSRPLVTYGAVGPGVGEAAAARPSAEGMTRADAEAARELAPAAGVARAPLSTLRRTIMERMAASARTTAPVTLTSEVDAGELVRLRARLKGDPSLMKGPAPSYTDLLALLVAQALVEHPQLNARLEEGGIVPSEAVHIGIAVDTDRGLLVPVLRDVQAKRLGEIAEQAHALIERARAGMLTPDELRGGTFTITNLGMFEIDAFTPIINLPECAILGMGRIAPRQVVLDAEAGRVGIRQMAFLSLTFDHRLVDGAPAARFLQRVKRLVEQPCLALLGRWWPREELNDAH